MKFSSRLSKSWCQSLILLDRKNSTLVIYNEYLLHFADKDSLHENITYRHLKTDHFDSDEIKEIMGYINKGIMAKVIQPLDFSCYPHTQIQHAFHGLQDPNKLKSVLVQV